MNIQELLKRQQNLIELKQRIETALSGKDCDKNNFHFRGYKFTQRDLVDGVLVPMMQQYLENTQAELDKVNTLVKSVNCLIAGTMPEKVNL